jgi:hypothetical protein
MVNLLLGIDQGNGLIYLGEAALRGTVVLMLRGMLGDVLSSIAAVSAYAEKVSGQSG